jgi:drug/metabolite transporter (DMT)-like permease
MQARVTITLIFAVLVISTASTLIKLADAPALVIAAVRLGIAGLVLTPAALVLRRSQLTSLFVSDGKLALLSGALLSLHFFTWISSLQFTSVASSVILVATNPIFVGLGSVVLLKEKLKPLLVAGMAVSITGAILISLNDLSLGGGAFYGDLLAILGAITHSGYLLIGQRLRAKADNLTYITLVYGTAAVLLVGAALISGMSFAGYSSNTYWMMLLLAIGPQLIGHSSYNWALRYLTAAVIAVVILAEPIGASALAYFILGEQITLLEIFGGVLVLIGIALAIRSAQRPRLELNSNSDQNSKS